MKVEMEYNLLKTIEANLGTTIQTASYPRLTPYPATDFVNPGVGQIGRLYSFYVPLHSHNNLHTISKKVNLDNLEGSGNEQTETKKVQEESVSEPKQPDLDLESII